MKFQIEFCEADVVLRISKAFADGSSITYEENLLNKEQVQGCDNLRKRELGKRSFEFLLMRSASANWFGINRRAVRSENCWAKIA